MHSFAFKGTILKLQRSPILCHDAHDVIRCATWYVYLDLQRHPHVGADQADQVGEDFVGDTAGVAADALRVEGDGAVVALGAGLGGSGGLGLSTVVAVPLPDSGVGPVVTPAEPVMAAVTGRPGCVARQLRQRQQPLRRPSAAWRRRA